MAGRVSALSASGVAGKHGVSVFATPSIVDAAVDEVLQGEHPTTVGQVKTMWARDGDSEVASMLRAGAAAMADRARFPLHARLSANVPYAVDEEGTRTLTNAFPELQISFRTSAGHEHGIPASVRHLDTMVLKSELPPRMPYVDFGGKLVPHVQAADIKCTVVRSTLDAKDPTRVKRDMMELRRIVTQHATADVNTREGISRQMAASILAGEDRYYVEDRLETFTRPFRAGIMSHVYDVPISAIPYMMERCGMKIFLFTMHFSNRFFDTDSGDIPSLRARYVIDRKADTFKMGFIGSGAQWYTHKYSEFLRYGADQILCGSTNRYSMKIIKRRGETLTYRVLQVGGGALPETHQYYNMPDVPCVEVVADLASVKYQGSSELRRVFAEDVWKHMVKQIALLMSRGVYDYHRYVGIYRQLSAGHSYNGVDAVLGSVPVERLPELIALSSVAAAVMLAQIRAGVKYGIDVELANRVAESASTLDLSFRVLYEGLKGVLAAPFNPVLRLFESLINASAKTMMVRLAKVVLVENIKRIPVDIYQTMVANPDITIDVSHPYDLEYRRNNYELDKFLQDMVLEAAKPVEVDIVAHTVDGMTQSEPGLQSGSTTVVGDAPPASGLPDWMPLGDDMEQLPVESYHTAGERVAAIREEIEIVHQEAANLEAWFHERWSRVMSSGSPDVAVMVRNRDAWKNLDAWYVNSNVISRSASGRDLSAFEFSGVYCPVASLCSDGTKKVYTKLLHVEEHTWSSTDGSNQRVHKVIGSVEPYTGWVLVNARMLVLNGPQVVAGLKRALDHGDFGYTVGAYKGGPGCGKTYSILQRWNKSQQIMSPLAASVDDIRRAMVKKGGITLLQTQRVARTIDSWLCIAGRGQSVPMCSEILCDEAYCTRGARAYAAWALMRPKRVVAYGDDRQIPPVDTAGASRIYGFIAPRYVVMCYRIYRYGPEILALIASHYDYKLRSVHPVGYSTVKWINDPKDYVPQHEDRLCLVMYQAGKVDARKYMPIVKDRLSTTHEAQGKTVTEVLVAQVDKRRRPAHDAFDLYNSPEYVNVSFTRCTKLLVILQMEKGQQNVMVDWYRRAQDPRRIAACADLKTIGKPREFV
jgi:hypothetical protein